MIVPVALEPPSTEVGVTDTLAIDAALIVSVADDWSLPELTVNVATVLVATPAVSTRNVTVCCPPSTLIFVEPMVWMPPS